MPAKRRSRRQPRIAPYSNKEQSDRNRLELSAWTASTGVFVLLVSIPLIPFTLFLIFVSLVAHLRQDYKKYNKQEQEAAEELANYQRRASKALERLQRVRKLKAETKDHGNEVFHHGIEALNAYDGIN
jgi:flagellar biosynthesis component FlhA